jgi:hypothetical protein
MSEGVATPSAPMIAVVPAPGAPTGEEMPDLERLLDRKITQNEILKEAFGSRLQRGELSDALDTKDIQMKLLIVFCIGRSWVSYTQSSGIL